MKAIMVMFDSLNRRLLPPYGCDWVKAPNFARLAARSVTFENAYVGSMPCMPARREIHTGRHNFLHRGWGPLEPFDDSMPAILDRHGVYTHLVSDHYHYWEDGGATYHNRYSSWEFARGQEGDQWKADVAVKEPPASYNPPAHSKRSPHARQDFVNRQWLDAEEKMPQAVTFRLGLEFLEKNHAADNWFLTVETFDPHEPFFTQPEYKAVYPEHDYDALGVTLDWPPYRQVQPGEEGAIADHFRYEYAALVTMCDRHLGRILDAMDRYDLWKDTLLIVNTDHGFLLGEHGWFAKNGPPLYDEIAHTPLFVWDPRCGRRGERNDALVQTIDLAPTLLEYFNLPVPKDMRGVPLRETLAEGTPGRDAALFGYFGQHLCVTDGRCVYMRGPVNDTPLHEYTLMPTRMRGFFSPEALVTAELHPGFSFTKGCRVLKVPAGPANCDRKTLLFDLQTDPGQEQPLADAAVEARMLSLLGRLLAEHDAPPECFAAYGVERPEA